MDAITSPRHRWAPAAHRGVRAVRLVAALLLVALVAAPAASAATSVQGNARISSLRFEQMPPSLDGEAYFVGFRTGAGDEHEPTYHWSFQAESIDVFLERTHYFGDAPPIHQETTTERTTHEDASGVLTQSHPLAYLLAVSAESDDPEAFYGLQLEVPMDALEAHNSIAFQTTRASEADNLPELPDTFNNRWSKEYKRPWGNLQHDLRDHHDPLVLTGDFTIHVFDMGFQIRNGTSDATAYNATFGGARGDDIPSPLHEYNNTQAELRFTNATFTFLPDGIPLQVNLRSADVAAAGNVYLLDAVGTLRGDDIDIPLSSSMVQMDAEALDIEVRAEQESPPRYGVAFEGTVRSAAVDGRSLDLAATGASSVGGNPDILEGSAWWLLPLLAILALVGLVGVGRALLLRQARIHPEYVILKGQTAFEHGRMSRARTLAGRVLRYHPEDRSAISLTAMLHIQRKQHKVVMSFLEPHLGGPADEEGILSVIYCVAMSREKGKEAARRFLRSVVKSRPDVAKLARDFPQLKIEGLLPDDSTAHSGPNYI